MSPLLALSPTPWRARLALAAPLLAFAPSALGAPPAPSTRIAPLRVSGDHRFLTYADGRPFLYLADTAWELFHRTTREEASLYLENRRQKGFTVVQAVVLAELDGLRTPNSYGHRPLVDDDPGRPNEKYFEHVDYVVKTAAAKGIYVAMLPTWADKVVYRDEPNVVFDAAKARAYGKWLGARYRAQENVIWVLGGDREPSGFEPVFTAMAEGLAEGEGAAGRHLKTFHPNGRRSSSDWFHAAPWLDFNMIQSGHNYKDNTNFEVVRTDYLRTPPKPVIDGEPRYENHPVDWKPHAKGWFDDFDVRQAAYWALLAGAAGHTYGCHDIWQMNAPGRPPIAGARTHWKTALDLPGAFQMTWVRRLMEARPMLARKPDQHMFASRIGYSEDALVGARGDDHLLVYASNGKSFTLRMGRIRGGKLTAHWYDPRTGNATAAGTVDNEGHKSFDPPGHPERGNDWVLVLDDASKGYPPPGPLAPAAPNNAR